MGLGLTRHRDRAIVATQIGRGSTDLDYNRIAWSPDEVTRSVEASLTRKRLDAIDVTQLHGGDYGDGEDRYILESGTLEALARLRSEGKVRYLGLTCEGSSGAAERLIDSGRF